MTPPSFHRLVDDYLRVRRGLGFDLESTEWKLRDFATYADRIGHSGAVTIELAVEWAQSSRSSNPAQAVRRLAAVSTVRATPRAPRSSDGGPSGRAPGPHPTPTAASHLHRGGS